MYSGPIRKGRMEIPVRNPIRPSATAPIDAGSGRDRAHSNPVREEDSDGK
jgi:hypothetical protein